MSEQHPVRVNYRRRTLGVLICLAPIALLLASLAWGNPFSEWRAAGLALAIIALGIGLLNSYLSFGRPLLHRWRHGSLEGLRNISGFPGVGTMLIIVAGLFAFGDKTTAVLGLLAASVDTGGSLWFLIATWSMSELWDA